MHIRKATRADAVAVNAIIEEVYVGGGWADPVTSPQYVQTLLDAAARIEQACVLLAELDGRAVGTVTVTDRPPLANIAKAGELEVRMLGVLAHARRLGVAQALMQECEQLARQTGKTSLVLSTEPAMVAALALYLRLGFARTPDRDWTINGTRLITFGRDCPHEPGG